MEEKEAINRALEEGPPAVRGWGVAGGQGGVSCQGPVKCQIYGDPLTSDFYKAAKTCV